MEETVGIVVPTWDDVVAAHDSLADKQARKGVATHSNGKHALSLSYAAVVGVASPAMW